MSNVVDNRVLEMRFDNKQFESGVSTTMSTLDKLKQKLNLSGASKGLEELDRAAKRTDISAIGRGVEAVQAKFSALQVIGVTALANITNSAVNAGKRIASALTIEPVKTGFQEYETQIGAIQTILANTESKGSTLQDVNRALAELNTYADKTIYNFTEMTKNIGTFTAAGVELDKSVTSIKGIANLAAISGSTSQQASVAMYQLSQALAAGRVSLMDWNSVVNAGMGGEVFQTALKRTATQMGTNVDALIDKYGSFRESLTQGNWLTAEVLTETLTQLSGAYTEADLIAQGYTEQQAKDIVKLADTAVGAATEVKTFTQLWDTLKESAQSGWTQSWQTIIGDFGEAKELLTGISNTVGDFINKTSEARNKVLTEGLSSGWKQMLNQGIADEEGFKDSIKSVAKERGIAIDKMIEQSGSFEKSLKQGWLTGDILTESLDKMTKKVSGMSEEQLKAAGYTKDQVRELQELNKAVKNGTVDIDEFAKKMKMDSGRENMIAGLTNIFKALGDVIKPIGEAFRDIFPATTGDQLYAFTAKFKEFTETLKVSEQTASKIKSTFKGVFAVFDIGIEAFKALAKGAFDIIGSLTGLGGGILGISGSFGDFLSNIRDSIVEGNIFGNVVNTIVGFIKNAIGAITRFGSAIKDSVSASSAFEGMLGFFDGLWNIVKSVGSAIGTTIGDITRTIAEAFGKGDIFEVINSGLLAGVLLAIRKFITSLTGQVKELTFMERMKTMLDGVQEILGGVKDSLKAWQHDLQAKTLLKIAAAIGILAASLYVISGIDADKLGQSLGAIGILFVELVAAMATLNKLNDITVKPLAGIVGSLANISRIISMIGLGAAVLVLAGAMTIIASLDWDGVAKGLVGVAGLVTVLVAAARLMTTESKSITKFAGQMILLSAAVAALAAVAKTLGSMSWEGLAKGGVGIFGIVAMLVGAAKIMDTNDRAITKFAGQMLLFSAAISALAMVAKSLGSMSWEGLAKGGAGILGLVTMLVAAAKIMSSGKGSIAAFGGQMLLMSASLAVLAPVLKSIGSLSVETLAKGLISIGAALTVLSIGLKSMTGSVGGSVSLLIAAGALAALVPTISSLGSMGIDTIVKSLVTLAAAFAVIGAAGYLLAPLIPALLGLSATFVLFGVSVAAIGAGILAVAAGLTALAAGATAIVAGLTVIVTGVLELIPAIAQIIGRAIVEIATVIGDYAPQLATSFLKLLLGVMESLAQYTPQLVDALLTFLIDVINSLADHVPSLIQAAMNLIGAIFEGIVTALNGLDTSSLLKGVLAVGIMTALMYALSGVVALIPSAMMGMLGVGAVIAEMALVLAAIGGLAQIPGLEWLIGEGGDLLQKVGTAIGQFIGGIAGGIASGFSSSLPSVATDLSTFMTNIQPFIEGAKAIDPSMMMGVQTLAKTIMMLTAANLLESITSFITGGSSLSDFAKQLVPFGKGMKEFGASVAGIDTAAITASATAAKALTEVANAIPKEGGLWGLLSGDRDLGSFGEKLVPFGLGMKVYSTSVAGINASAIVASATAAKALTEVANAIPKEGGLWQLLSGENDLGSFGTKLVPFGLGMKLYSSAVAGLNSESIVASATAARALVSVAEAIPSEGGLWQLLSGDKDLASFGSKLVPFGIGMKAYSIAVAGIDMASIMLSANAARALVAVAEAIPAEGGLWQLLSGDKDLAEFGTKLVPFGLGMKAYATAVAGVDSSSIIMSATAAKSLVSVLEAIPEEGALWGLLGGDKDLGAFGDKLVPFGHSMKLYAAAVAGIDSMSIMMSAMAARALISVAEAIPAEGGFWSLVDGEKDLASFGSKLIPFGTGMKMYAMAVAGIDTASIAASVPAAMALVSVANAIPAEGGFWSLVDGEKDLGSFGTKLVPFGLGMKMYAMSVAGIDSGSVTASVPAAKAMVEVAKAMPTDMSSMAGVIGMVGIAPYLNQFGTAMKSYAVTVAGINTASIQASVSAAKSLVSLINSTAGMNTSGVGSFVSAINQLGKANVSQVVAAFKGAGPQLASVGASLTKSLASGLNAGRGAVVSAANQVSSAMSNAFKSKAGQFQQVGAQCMTRFATGIRSGRGAVVSSASALVSAAASECRNRYSTFYSAGASISKGLAAGIRSGVASAKAAARELAKAAEDATRAKLRINSPSKVFRDIGKSVPEGFVQGIRMMGSAVKRASLGLADNAIASTTKSLARIHDIAMTDTDIQPTISPIVDLDNVKSSAKAIGSLLNTNASVGLNAKLNSISTTMRRRSQNGENKDVVSAIDKLGKKLGNLNNTTYNVNGVNVNGNGDVEGAIETLIRAALIEGRA